MPTVLRRGGFRVQILLPPREHGPAHVHVAGAGGVVTIVLPEGGRPMRVRKVIGMRDVDVVAAIRLVEENIAFLLVQWHLYHD